MAATVSVTTLGRVATMANLAAIKVTVDANSVSYATSLGGLAIDLFAALGQAGPMGNPPNGNDIIGVLPLATTAPGKFLPWALTVGTVTSTTVPCYLKFIASGSVTSAGFTEPADGVSTQTCSFLLLVARGGAN